MIYITYDKYISTTSSGQSNILQNNEMEGPAVKVYEIVVGFKPRVLNQAFQFSPTQNWE